VAVGGALASECCSNAELPARSIFVGFALIDSGLNILSLTRGEVALKGGQSHSRRTQKDPLELARTRADVEDEIRKAQLNRGVVETVAVFRPIEKCGRGWWPDLAAL
jgi:hypothetical protein